MTEVHETPAFLAAWKGSLTPRFCDFRGNAGGFSGAKFWKIGSQFGEFCLRRWPQEHPTAEHLKWIHAVIEHAAQQGQVPLAVALRTDQGATFAQHEGHLWELAPWLPGEAFDFSQGEVALQGNTPLDQAKRTPTAKLTAAAMALGRFHASTASFSMQDKPVAKRWGVSPGIAARWDRIQQLDASRFSAMKSAVGSSNTWPGGEPLAIEILDLAPKYLPTIRTLVGACLKLEVALQPCLRDIWSDHILFTGDQVTGLIDYGAMRVESVAADFARLMGSIVGDDIVGVKDFLWAYNTARRENLSPEECQLANAFDATQVLFSGLNWIEWIYVERRTFPDMQRIGRRMQAIVCRLRQRAKE